MEGEARTPLQAALRLAEEQGYPVFPCREDKTPYTEHGFKDASRSIEQIIMWWTEHPNALIGVPTGKASGLFVYDFDAKGMPWLKENRDRFAGCARIHCTLHEGRHLYYEMPKEGESWGCSASVIAPGVDTRGEGGYVIWWPAHGRREFVSGGELQPPPIKIPKKKTETPTGNGGSGGKYGPGERHAALLKHASYLRHRGIKGTDLYGAMLAWNNQHCDPPQDEAEVLKIISAYEQKPEDPEEETQEDAKKRLRCPITTDEWVAPVPPRDWAIKDWIPKGCVTLFAGASGMGKTLLAQAMASSLYLKRPYLDHVHRPLRVLAWFSEDDRDELRRRQVAIARDLLVDLDAFGDGYFIQPLAGEDVLLVSQGVFKGRDKLLLNAPYFELRDQIIDYQADLVILDTTARLYGGNENDRQQVTQFIAFLTSLANIRGSSIVLIAHPAKAKGSEYSGSTAWEGSVRSRLYLDRRLPGEGRKDDDGEEEFDPLSDTGTRYLSRRKSNYSALDCRRLQITKGGVMVPDSPPEKVDKAQITPEFIRAEIIRGVRQLKAMGIYGSENSQARASYLPLMIQQYQMCPLLKLRHLETGMRELMVAGVLIRDKVGQYANRTTKYGLVLKEGDAQTP